MANYTGEVNNFENIRQKICEATAGMIVTTYEYFHFDKNPYVCGGDTFDFKRGTDFDMLEPEAGDFSIERTEQTSTQALKQTSANAEQSLEWSQEFPIRARYGDRLNTYLLRVLMDEYQSGRNGKGIVAYSNNGISYTKKVVFNEGMADEFAVVLFFPYLKAESWPNVYMGDLTEESTVNLNVKIENMPLVTFEGTMPAWFGLPQDVQAAEITFDTITYDATTFVAQVEGLTLVDPDLIASVPDTVHAKVYDVATGELLIEVDIDAASPATASADFSDTEPAEIMVVFSYYVSETLEFFAYITNLTPSAAVLYEPSSLKALTEKLPRRR